MEEIIIHSALIIFNCINKYFNINGEKYLGGNCQQVIRNIREKLILARKVGNPIYFLIDDMPQPKTKKRVFNYTLKEELEMLAGESVIYLNTLSSFYNTTFEIELNKNSINEIILVGTHTNTSIFLTALEAKIRGLNVIVFEDCIISDDRIAHSVFINEMIKHGVEVF